MDAVKADPTRVYLDDPSFIRPDSGSVAELMSRNNLITVTNHPKRSWYVQIKRNADGTIKAT